jgi:hypothetical protein
MALHFFEGEVSAELTSNICLAVIQNVPALQVATSEQTQYIFDCLVGALAAQQLTRIAARTARFFA